MFYRLITPKNIGCSTFFACVKTKTVFELFQKHHATNLAYVCLSSNVWSFGRLSNIACQTVILFLTNCNNLHHFTTQQHFLATRRSCLCISNNFIVPKCSTAMFLDVAKLSNINCKANLKCFRTMFDCLGRAWFHTVRWTKEPHGPSDRNHFPPCYQSCCYMALLNL